MSDPVDLAPELALPPADLQTDSIELMRRFCADWLNKANADVCRQIMSAEYRVEIGGIVLSGLAEYVPATLQQLRQFPGLEIVVHEVISNGNQMALRFTEHGGSTQGNYAAWVGIALFWSDGSVLVRNVTEEDYTSRRRQLGSGVPDALSDALLEPWVTEPRAPNAGAETRVRDWLEAGGLSVRDAQESRLTWDEGAAASVPILNVTSTIVLDLFSAGETVVFRVVESGGYHDGLDLPDQLLGKSGSLSSVGIVRADRTNAITGHVVRDRAGLRRALSRA
ncbi:hypothetical protein E3T39_04095 [Cryobacterium suzukii]|uniref:Uncharacterized protein n=1 Tax=Cryobacterium suzukii TaxID=1259198 RepID=A0A4R9AIJ2_9MICO|nr:nuclear transport factor 2 family protein [Cryobacterium suzukii]TFD62185.1 hypothetical protein E3T39_04095 [Cryobacterium suzukii]